ncbi:hypothetical protein HYC85_021854 [Camellia sinensis]|uniref:DNA topoisomerase (ATP-hydrolyzing) n=1 Tax=Camellia sinensis TaxID=4442 RepID=A0A7J7GJM1_CAMSI|nr:hypothetical protein HYC85_021854 [Camellia sinensis]
MSGDSAKLLDMGVLFSVVRVLKKRLLAMLKTEHVPPGSNSSLSILSISTMVRVKPGESALAFYIAENQSSTPITGVSTYNVTPMKLVFGSSFTFKPDLAKFNTTRLEDDVVALMKKRVIDLAGCLGKTVKVDLNGQRIPVKSFLDYVNLYLQSACKARPDALPRAAVNRIISLTESTIASRDDEGCIKVWDTRQRTCCNSFDVHEEYISDMTLASDSIRLLGTSYRLLKFSLCLDSYMLNENLEMVPARAVAAAAVARALAGLPPHQRYSLPSSSEELSSIYGSKPHGQVVEELEEEFYEEVFLAHDCQFGFSKWHAYVLYCLLIY